MNRNTIINKSFTRAFLGYDAAEVDSFLDDVIREFDTMRHELDVARLRNKMLLDELDRFRRQAKEAADAEADNEAAKALDPMRPRKPEPQKKRMPPVRNRRTNIPKKTVQPKKAWTYLG